MLLQLWQALRNHTSKRRISSQTEFDDHLVYLRGLHYYRYLVIFQVVLLYRHLSLYRNSFFLVFIKIKLGCNKLIYIKHERLDFEYIINTKNRNQRD